MSVVIEHEELTEFAEDFGIPLNGCGAEPQEELPQIRRDKVLAIRLELAKGTYDLDGRLDAVLERLLTMLYA